MKAVFKIPHENRKGHICTYKIFLVCCYTGSSITFVGEGKKSAFWAKHDSPEERKKAKSWIFTSIFIKLVNKMFL